MTLISVRDLTHVYPGGVTALRDLTLELEPGIIGFVGANGAGKSTLHQDPAGAARPDPGAARVFGMDVRHASPRSASAWATCPSTTACRRT